ncbi:MAG: NAD(P)/FAD-dependent oxidoreductase [Phycisphaerales bacterium]
MTNNHQFDAVIIGAGPAGCSAAAILAEHGRRVAVLEREVFPRYRVGESLIPHCWYALDRLGLVDRLDASDFIVHKHSVQFVSTEGVVTTPFYFQRHCDHPSSRTWQVKRDAFDRMMRDNAVAKGATLFQPMTARELVRNGERIVGVMARDANGNDHTFTAPITLDASGRDMFAVGKQQWRVNDASLKKIAIWSYFKGGKRDEGINEGATTVAYLPEKGWFWYIPLPDDIVSVGAVAERDYLYRGERDPQVILNREIALQPWIREHLAHATQVEQPRVTGDYSYRSKYCASDGLVLIGDAFAFLDPVFSSGVFLALESGVMAGDAVHAALDSGDVSAATFETYGARMRQAIEAMRRLVYAFYDETFSFGEFLKEYPDLGRDLTDCLIGNVYKNLEPLFEAMGELANVPQPLAHGGPLLESARA